MGCMYLVCVAIAGVPHLGGASLPPLGRHHHHHPLCRAVRGDMGGQSASLHI